MQDENVKNAAKIKVAERKQLSMPWKTKENVHDSGIFLMRHMEVFKGVMRRDFECFFKKEGKGQQQQLDGLRSKYLVKILLSDTNLKREQVLLEIEDYEKLSESEKKALKENAYRRINERQ